MGTTYNKLRLIFPGGTSRGMSKGRLLNLGTQIRSFECLSEVGLHVLFYICPENMQRSRRERVDGLWSASSYLSFPSVCRSFCKGFFPTLPSWDASIEIQILNGFYKNSHTGNNTEYKSAIQILRVWCRKGFIYFSTHNNYSYVY